MKSYDEPLIWDLQYENDNPEYGLRVVKMLLDHGADPNIEWEGQGFYYYVATKEISSSIAGEHEYIMALCELLEDYGGDF